MPQSKIGPADLHRLLDEAPEPLYVLDQKRVIVFCNRACVDWVGVKASELLGRRVDYVAGDTASGPPGVAAGLCPPPAAFTGKELTGHVSCLSPQGRLVHRRARFVPLGHREADCEGVVAFVAEADLQPAEMSRDLAPAEDADQLHLEIRRFRAQQAQRYGLEQLIGRSSVMHQVRAQVALAAESRAAVLIVGPAGSGRAHVGRAIFYQSSLRRSGRLVPVEAAQPNVDALRQAFESLTSAAPDAASGTLLLQDADQLPAGAQQLLAEMLAHAKRPASILATARVPLLTLAEQGAYHEELARRLSTLVIHLPALAARMEDLPLLAQAFLERQNALGEKQLGGLSAEALDLLALHAWPGNLDELADAIGAAHAAASGYEVLADDLPLRIRHAAQAAAYPQRVEETIDLESLLCRLETELIQRALTRAKGNKTRAAKLLGMTRARFYRRLENLGLVESHDAAASEDQSAAELPQFEEDDSDD